ncbi:hypothetical protein SAMN05216188_13617 [Lentzea xinjiangensis]|uniref:Uncharacterized protein n=1 Tax=Lentzea xinjiangensis TaxID=402600 RepID=A0A1H9WLC4_9PSEU|nr:hypothetical protein SAMN05216188_13617 [Lentzea xinjiangensis]
MRPQQHRMLNRVLAALTIVVLLALGPDQRQQVLRRITTSTGLTRHGTSDHQASNSTSQRRVTSTAFVVDHYAPGYSVG